MERKIVPDIVSNPHVESLTPDTTVADAARKMAGGHFGAVMVTEGDSLKGIFTERDLLERVVAKGLSTDSTKLADVMTSKVDTVHPDASATSVLEMMRTHNYRHVPIVDDNDKPVGMVSIRDLYDHVKDALETDLKEREAYIFGSAH